MESERKKRASFEDAFGEALENAADLTEDPNFRAIGSYEKYKALTAGHGGNEGVFRERTQVWPELSDSAENDPYSHKVKPDSKHWKTVPETEKEKALYMGVHIHAQDNPFGLHTHVPGGAMGGGHSHGPQNPFGSHSHKEVEDLNLRPGIMLQLDGKHTHEYGENLPSGPHEHSPESFG